MRIRAACALAAALVAWSARAGTWTQLFAQGAERNTVNDAAAMPLGGWIVAGEASDFAWVVRIDAAGAVEWQRTYEVGSVGFASIVGVAPLPDGGAVALGMERAWRDGGSAEAFVLRLDASGAVVSCRAEGNYPHGIVSSPDGSWYSIIGTYSGHDLSIVHHDPAGDVDWTRELLGVAIWSPGSSCGLADGGLGIVGIGGGGRGPWLARLAADGTLLGQRAFDVPIDRAIALRETADSGLVALLAGVDPGAEAIVLRVDPHGSLEWLREHALDRGRAPLAFDVAADGALTILGGSETRGAVVLSLDASGEAQWMRSFGTGRTGVSDRVLGEIENRGVVRFSDGGLLLGCSFSTPTDDRALPALVAMLDERGSPSGCLETSEMIPSGRALPLAAPVAATASLVDAGLAAAVDRRAVARDLLTEPCLLPCVADSQEPDDGCGAAHEPGRAPFALAGNFCNDAEDWLRLDACPGDVLTIEMDPFGSLADAQVELFGPDCSTLLASDDGSGPPGSARLSWTATSSVATRLRVRQRDGSVGPDRSYRLAVAVRRLPQDTHVVRSGPFGMGVEQCSRRPGGGFVVTGGDLYDDPWSMATTPDGAVDWCVSGAGGMPCAAASDGGALLCTWLSAPGRLVLTRVDATGGVVWERAVDASQVIVLAAIELVDRGFLVGGYVGSSHDGWLLRLDAGGAILTHRTLAIRSTSSIRSLAAAPDGGAFAAMATREGSSPSIATVLELDAAMRVAWARDVTLAGVEVDGHGVVAALADGGVAMAFRARDGLLGLARFDASGAATWSHGLRRGDQFGPGSLDAAIDGTMVMACGAWSPGTSESLAVRLDASGRPSWARRIGDLESDPDARIVAVDLLPSGDVLAASVTSVVRTDTDALGLLSVRMDASGRAGPCAGLASVQLEDCAVSLQVAPALVASTDLPVVVTSDSLSVRPRPYGIRDACACGCPDAPPSEVSPIGTNWPLRVERSGRISWEASPPSCRSYDLYRGELARLRSDGHGSCLATGLLVNEADDPQEPPPGGAWFYLVAARTDMGTGGLGLTSLGAPRSPTSPCP